MLKFLYRGRCYVSRMLKFLYRGRCHVSRMLKYKVSAQRSSCASRTKSIGHFDRCCRKAAVLVFGDCWSLIVGTRTRRSDPVSVKSSTDSNASLEMSKSRVHRCRHLNIFGDKKNVGGNIWSFWISMCVHISSCAYLYACMTVSVCACVRLCVCVFVCIDVSLYSLHRSNWVRQCYI